MPRKNQPDQQDWSLELIDVQRAPHEQGVEALELRTNAGTIICRLHAVPDAVGAVVWVGGAGGGLDGPAWGLYPRLAQQLTDERIASLRLHYRYPNHLEDCVLDTLLGALYMHQEGAQRIALVGHSFGGAVVITAGSLSEEVAAVVAMSSQTYGTTRAPGVSPRPLLLIHGTADEVLPDRCSRDIYTRARDPKELLLYPGCRHGLDECRDEVDRDLLAFLRREVGKA